MPTVHTVGINAVTVHRAVPPELLQLLREEGANVVIIYKSDFAEQVKQKRVRTQRGLRKQLVL